MDSLAHGGKVLSDHAQCRAGFPAQEEFVRVTCHIHELSTFEGCTGRRPAREPEEDSTHDLDTIVVHGVHLHGDWDQISLTQAKATDNLCQP